MPAPPEPSLVTVELGDEWAYGAGTLHGGWLLELAARHALAAGDHPHPLAVSGHFLAAPRVGQAQVEVTPLRSGRSTGTARAALLQDGRCCLDAVVTSGSLGTAAPAHVAGPPPQLPPLERCLRGAPIKGEGRNGITEQLDLRLDPDAGGQAGGPAGPQQMATGQEQAATGRLSPGSGPAQVRGWVRYASGRLVDGPALVCLADALPPVTDAMGLTGWVPTVELTVHVRALPAPGWLRAVQWARLLQGGWLDETCELWDSDDRLVAQGHQLAGYRPG